MRGLERLPDGPALYVGNHDGGVLPTDAIAFGTAWHRHHRRQRPLRILMHDVVFKLTATLRDFLHGIGALSATPHNLDAALAAGESCLLFPGAAREAFRPFSRRRDVDFGGRTGFLARALRAGVPVVPVVSAGAHETFFVLTRGERIAERLGIKRRFRADAWPLCAGLPWGLWWGPMWPYLPLPSKLTVEVLAPMHLANALPGRRLTRSDADDKDVVRELYAALMARVRPAIARLYDERRFPVLG